MRPASQLLRQYRALSEAERSALAAAKWTAADSLSKRFAMPSHTAAAAFALRVARHADALNHHPEIRIRYRFVTFELRTNDTGSLTQLDAELARAIDGLKAPPGA